MKEQQEQAIKVAVVAAQNYFGERYEHYEVWEQSENEVTIRAWTKEDEDGENEYRFFTGLIRNKAPEREAIAIEVLREVKAYAGRNYKSAIRQAWMDGNYDREGLGKWAGRLQQIRNEFGPSWLVRASVLEPEPESDCTIPLADRMRRR